MQNAADRPRFWIPFLAIVLTVALVAAAMIEASGQRTPPGGSSSEPIAAESTRGAAPEPGLAILRVGGTIFRVGGAVA